MPGVGERREQVGVLLAAAQQVVGRDEAVGGARHAPVALEAGPDEPLVGQVVAGEERRDALEERGLRQRPGGREEAEDGPLDPVRERDRGGFPVLRVAEPPATGLDLHEARVARSGHLVADEREQPIDRIGRRLALRRDAQRARSKIRRRADRAIGTRSPGAGDRVRRRIPTPVPTSSHARSGRRALRPPRAGRTTRARPHDRGEAARGVRRGQPAKLAGAIEPDEDLAEEPFVAGRLAAGAQRLDGGVGHGPRRLSGRERSLVEALRGGEKAGTRDQVRVAGAARERGQRDVGPRPRPRAAETRPAAGTRPIPPTSSSPSASRALTSR